MEIREILAFNLKRLRADTGLSQEELAHRAGIDGPTSVLWSAVSTPPASDLVDRLAKELGVEAAELLRKPPANS